MRFAALGLGATVALVGSATASADVRIASDHGGKIGDYFTRYQKIRQSGDRVIIDGPCLSACTLVVAILPREQLCATRNAVLGFHAAWMPERARPVTSPPATRALFSLYPPRVRAWIAQRGGLTDRMLLMQGRELAAVVPPCESALPDRRGVERRRPPRSSTSAVAEFPSPARPGVLDMRAKKWQFEYSPGMPANPTEIASGWQFTFPKVDGVHYLVTRQRLPPIPSKSISMSIVIETSGSPTFNFRTNQNNDCDNPATVRLYFQRNGDDLSGQGEYEFFRWWSKTAAHVLAPGSVVLTANLTKPSEWVSVFGKSGDANVPAFREALANVGAIGMAFGGGCFLGHGVFVNPGSGGVVFKATSYEID